jgi:tetratricopeptide (TPR) repeat protein
MVEGNRRARGEENPQSILFMYELARLYLDQDKLSQAEPLAKKALELSGRVRGEEHFGTIDCRGLLGRVYQAQGKLAEAETSYAKMVEVSRRAKGDEHPDTWDAMAELTVLYLQQNKLLHGERIFRLFQSATRKGAADATDAKLALICGRLGMEFEQSGRIKEAEAAYRESAAVYDILLAKAPDQVRYQNNLAWLLATCPLEEVRDPRRAIELARNAVEVEPTNASIWNTVGTALYRNRDWSGAIDSLNRSMSLLGDNSPLFSNNAFFLAMAHWQLGHKDEARQWYCRALEWMERSKLNGGELSRFRAEAASLLGLEPGTDRKGQHAPSDGATVTDRVLHADPAAARARGDHFIGQSADAAMPNGPNAFAQP